MALLNGEIMSATGTEKSLSISEKDGEGGGRYTDFTPPEDPDKAFSKSDWFDSLDLSYESSGEWQYPFESGRGSVRGESIINEIPYPIYAPQEEETVLEEESEEEEIHETSKLKTYKAKAKKLTEVEDIKSKSLFVHSFPGQFPDVMKTRNSAFGSIFLKTSTEITEDIALLKSIADSSYIRLNSLLNSFEKIISDVDADAERKRSMAIFKESLRRTLESYGISRTYSDGSIHWDIYPVTQNHLFSVYLKDRLHQTRDLARIEERILESRARVLKPPSSWPTKSIWSGYWDSLGMTSSGIYSMPHGVSYFGKMQDGVFHDTNATLTYPNKFKALNCVFDKGKLLSCQFQFPDLLVYEDDWKYCKFPDRRFWSEVQNGLKSAKVAQKTQVHPPRTIPPGCYDTGDGFYNPKSLMLESPFGKLLRVPVCEEDMWIKKYCRKGFFEYSGFRPDLFENWFNFDKELIDSILEQQALFRTGKISYDELQQFYADSSLLPSFSPFKKKKTKEEIKLEEFIKSIPEPKFLKPERVKKFEGHKIQKVTNDFVKTEERKLCKGSKSFINASSASQNEVDPEMRINNKFSKVSFKYPELSSYSSSILPGQTTRRNIPEKFLAHQSILKFPFQPRRRDRKTHRKKCLPQKFSSSSSEVYLQTEADTSYAHLIARKNLQKYMKHLIMDVVTDILKKERDRHRKRLIWAQKISEKKPRDSDNKTLNILTELFNSIPDKEEFCDSDPHKTCNLKELAKDKYEMLKYWGKRILLLDFHEKPSTEGEEAPELPKASKLDLTINADAELLFAAFFK